MNRIGVLEKIKQSRWNQPLIKNEKWDKRLDYVFWFFIYFGPLWIFLRLFVMEFGVVASDSMAPTMKKGQIFLVDKISYRLKEPKRGEILVLEDVTNPDIPFSGNGLHKFFTRNEIVKRAIGFEGETVEIIQGRVYIDGKYLEEPYVKVRSHDNFGPFRVPPGHLFVLGDNRPESLDSRYVGAVNKKLLIGKIWRSSESSSRALQQITQLFEKPIYGKCNE